MVCLYAACVLFTACCACECRGLLYVVVGVMYECGVVVLVVLFIV